MMIGVSRLLIRPRSASTLAMTPDDEMYVTPPSSNAATILVMNGGRIVEQGSHAELMALGGFYADLYNSQFAGAGCKAVRFEKYYRAAGDTALLRSRY